MAENKDIAFKLEIDGVEQSIKSVKDLKSAIKSLQDEAENADLGSDQYKNAIENIEKLNDKLKEVTQTEKQAAQAMDDMAKSQKEAAKETGDLRKQFEVLEDELFLLAGQGKQNTKEFRDLANEAASLNKKIEQVNQSLEGGAVTKSAEGYQMLSGSFTSLKEGILELDFGKIKDGLQQARQGFVMFGQGAKTALQGVKGALIATGIGALVVLLGTIVAYWDDIKGAIDGVTEEQKKLNAVAKENLVVEQDKLKALESSTNSLKLQGKSEKEILELKLKQLDAVYEKAEVDLQNTIQTQLFQVEAEKRNKEILAGTIESLFGPLQLVTSAVDMVGKALGKNFGLAESISKMSKDAAKGLTSGDDAEKEAARKKELDASIQLLKDLKEKRAGFQLSIKKIDDDAANTATKNAEEAAKEYKAFLDKRNEEYLKSQEDELAALKKRLLDEDLLRQQQRENELSLDETLRAEKYKKRSLDAELNALNNKEDIDAQIALLEAKRQIELQNLELTSTERAIINKKYADQEDELKKQQAEKEKALEKKKQDEIVKIIEDSLGTAQNLSNIFFDYKKSKAEKGSKEEMELAKKQFNVNKALQLGFALMDSYKAVTASLAQAPLAIGPLPNPAGIASLAFAVTTSAANIAKIAASKFDSGASSGGGGGGGTPMPSIPAPPTIATSSNNTNQTTAFDENGKNLDFKQPQINVTATVGVDEIANKTNRVSVLEQQSTF